MVGHNYVYGAGTPGIIGAKRWSPAQLVIVVACVACLDFNLPTS